MDSPLIFKYLFFQKYLSDINDAPSQLDWGLNGTVGGATSNPSFLQGTRRNLDESPPFKWEWFSEPLDCPPNEGCSPEPMVGTMNPLEGNPRPFQGGEEVSWKRRHDFLLWGERGESAFEFFSAGWDMNTFHLKQLFEGLLSSPARHGYVIPA